MSYFYLNVDVLLSKIRSEMRKFYYGRLKLGKLTLLGSIGPGLRLLAIASVCQLETPSEGER